MYSQRIVLFVDILGFKELAEKEDGFEEVQRVYNRFKKMIQNTNQQFVSRTNSIARAIVERKELEKIRLEDVLNADDAEILFFSDCVVWTYRIDKLPKHVEFWQVLFVLCGCFNVLQSVLFSDKILIRGGVSIGSLFIEGNKIYGPALVKAYELERTTVYPRIAFDKDIIEKRLHQRFRPLFKASIEEYGKGHYAFNYFGTIYTLIKGEQKMPDEEVIKLSIKTFVEPLEISIANGIKHPDPGVRNKYEWLRSNLLSIPDLENHYDLTKLRSMKVI